MTKLYLITGFLGSGKTTFLHSFTGLFPNQKIALVINEFGAAGVDGTLLQDLKIKWFYKMYQTARVCQMQFAISNLLLINKTDLATREQIDDIATIALAPKPTRPVYETAFGKFDALWLEKMNQPQMDNGPIEGHVRDINLQKLTLTVSAPLFTRCFYSSV